jgi:hypothetical protein
MTKAQYKRELRLAREAQLRILAEAEANADPDYTANAAGFWLGLRRRCLTTATSRTSWPAASSDYSLST